MGGHADDDSAAGHAHRTLRLLQGEAAHRTTRRGDIMGGGQPTARPVHAPAPADLGLLDHFTACRGEVVEQVRAAVPNHPAPPAGDLGDAYQWWVDNTEELPAAAQQRRDAILYRQAMEHALLAGDETVIRRHPCPSCGTWGLFWRRAVTRAACVNIACADGNQGQSRTWTLQHLAQLHVMRQLSTVSTGRAT